MAAWRSRAAMTAKVVVPGERVACVGVACAAVACAGDVGSVGGDWTTAAAAASKPLAVWGSAWIARSSVALIIVPLVSVPVIASLASGTVRQQTRGHTT